MIGFEIIKCHFNKRFICKTDIASQGITQQSLKDRAGHGALFFHQRRFQPLHISKVSPLGSSPLASTGYSFLFVLGFFSCEKCSASVTSSSSRHMPIASKFSKPSPMKSKRAWQDAHCDFCWCNCTSVRTLGRGFSEDAISSGTLGGGGGGGSLSKTSFTSEPRMTGEVRLPIVPIARNAACVINPPRAESLAAGSPFESHHLRSSPTDHTSRRAHR